MQRGEKHNFLKRVMVSIMLAVFCGSSVLFALFYGNTAYAVGTVQLQFPVDSVASEKGPITEAKEKAEQSFAEAIGEALAVGFKNSVRYFTRRVATDFAKHLATKAAGQESLYFEQGWQNYLLSVADGVTGNFLDALGELNGFAKVNFCEPDLAIRVILTLGLKQYGYEDPICTVSILKKNWGDYINGYEFLDHFQRAFNPMESDFGAKLGLQTKMIELITQKEREALLERWNEKANKDLDDALTGDIRTPSSYLTRYFEVSSIETPFEEALSWTGKVAADTIGAFTNTFIITWATLMLQNLITPGVPLPGQLTSGGGVGGNPATVGEYYASVGKPDFRSSGVVDIVGEFLTCPDAKSRTANNCVIDEGFQQAIEQQMTVREAMAAGFLHGDWVFGYSDPLTKRQPDAKSGYALNNMKKLRVARVIPVGWELASDIISDNVNFNRPVTLREVVDAFDDPSIPSGTVPMNDMRRLSKMVDPNWVLKAPLQRCDQKAYGETIVGDGGAREEVCVDTKTCIKENADGTCADWGYCTREKNIWRFPGDACPGFYNSCETFADSEGDMVSYLENTVDKAECDASNAGCAWYCDSGNGSGNWQCSVAEADIKKSTNVKKIFNAAVESCTAQGAGCTELVSSSHSRGTNLIRNGSFEEFLGTADDLQVDTMIGFLDISSDVFDLGRVTTDSLFGSHALLVSDQIVSADVGILRQNAAYTASVWFNASSSVEVQLALAGQGIPGSGGVYSSAKVRGNGGWQRIVMDVNNPIITTAKGDVDVNVIVTGGTATIDGFQLEEGFTATDYSDYGSRNSVFLKKAPAYLDCEANPDLCKTYAPQCSDAEVGCELYTPVNGDPAVPGQVKVEDYCPAECVGYDTFVESPTDFTNGGNAYFVPSTAQSCSAEVAGCSQFTNLETEAVEYYANARRCVLPTAGGSATTFYTWEGSDENGFRLQVWSLKNTVGSVTQPDCAAGDTCTCSASDTNPDCRQFFSVGGVESYALYSQTVSVSDACARVRQTADATVSPTTREGICRSKGADWDVPTQSCIFNVLASESNACTATENGCREYKGNAAENVAVLMNDTFENGTASGWSAGGSANESLSAGGHSLRIFYSQGVAYSDKKMSPFIAPNRMYALSLWAKGSGDVTFALRSSIGNPSFSASFGTADLTPQWKQYVLNVASTTALSQNELDYMYLRIDGMQAGVEYYFDNITLKEIQENLYLVKDSWTTSASCNNLLGDPFGTQCGGGEVNPRECAPRIHLGCQAYFDRKGKTVNLKSFDNLCREEAIGCEELVDTKNNDTPFAKTYHAVCWRPPSSLLKDPSKCESGGQPVCTINPGDTSCYYDTEHTVYTPKINPQGDKITTGVCTQLQGCLATSGTNYCWVPFGKTSCLLDGDESTVTVPADELVYLVRDEKFTCTAIDKGCKALGVATIKPGTGTTPDSVEGFSTTYLKDDPEKYGAQLCSPQAISCKEYKSTAGTVYFKDPGNKLCEYRSKVVVLGRGEVTGWFRKGTEEPCDASLVSGGYGIFKNADLAYRGFVGACQEQYASCEEFVDRAATSTTNPEGEPYYFIDNQALANAKSECDGRASLTEGCVMFDQTGVPNKTGSSILTYEESKRQNYTLVPPKLAGSTTRKVCNADTSRACTSDADCVNYGGKCVDVKNDSNIIFKVNRDRVCYAWLECTVGESIADPVDQNRSRDVCYALDEFRERYVSGALVEEPTAASSAVLTASEYQQRALGWSTQRDYSGYSIPNRSRLKAAKEKASGGTYVLDVAGVDVSQRCRAYPQSTSPFQTSSANLPQCEDKEGCDCSYIEADAGDKAYYNAKNDIIPRNICTRPDKFGEQCDVAERTGSGNSARLSGNCVSDNGQEDLCRAVKGTKVYQGWLGYCLEDDLTRPLPNDPNKFACLQWYPLDVVRGAVNLFDYNTNAVYTQGPEYYCAAKTDPWYWWTAKDPTKIQGSAVYDYRDQTCFGDLQVENSGNVVSAFGNYGNVNTDALTLCKNYCNALDVEDVIKECKAWGENTSLCSIQTPFQGDRTETDIFDWTCGVVGSGSSFCSGKSVANYSLDEVQNKCVNEGVAEDGMTLVETCFATQDGKFLLEPTFTNTPGKICNALCADQDERQKLASKNAPIHFGHNPRGSSETEKDILFIKDKQDGAQSGKWLDLPSGLVGFYLLHSKEGVAKARYLYDILKNPVIYREQIESIKINVESDRSLTSEIKQAPWDNCAQLAECLGGSKDSTAAIIAGGGLAGGLGAIIAGLKTEGDYGYTRYDDNRDINLNNNDCLGLKGDQAGVFSMTLNEENGWTMNEESSQGAVEFSAGFNSQDGTLEAINVSALDQSDEGAFIVAGYEIQFKTSCTEIRRVKQGSEIYAYTATINKSERDANIKDALNNVQDRSSQISPWGATAGFAKAVPSAQNPPLDTLVISKTDAAYPYSGALWSGGKLSDTLFAAYFESWTLNKKTLKYSDNFSGARVSRNALPDKVSAPTISDIDVTTSKTASVTRATAEFYMYDLNGEGLPIRNITINWGDGTTPQKVESAFGNYAPLSVCETLKENKNWAGDTERCQTNKLRFTKIYNCPATTTGNQCVYNITATACNNFVELYGTGNTKTCTTRPLGTVTVPKQQ